jgi:hypothetical protein
VFIAGDGTARKTPVFIGLEVKKRFPEIRAFFDFLIRRFGFAKQRYNLFDNTSTDDKANQT